MIKKCAKCEATFDCKLNECWCYEYPALEIKEWDDCLCAACLTTLLKEQISEAVAAYRSGNKMPLERLSQHSSERLLEGIDYSIENGNWVFTEWFHLKRGYCCQNDCRHCAFR